MKMTRVLMGIVCVFSLCISSVTAAEGRTARILQVDGQAQVKIGAGTWTGAQTGMVLKQGDFVRTGMNSTVIVELLGENGTARVEVKPDSQLQFAELTEDLRSKTQNTLLDLALGSLLIQVDKLQADRSKFEVKTPTSIVGVRGTIFAVSVESIDQE